MMSGSNHSHPRTWRGWRRVVLVSLVLAALGGSAWLSIPGRPPLPRRAVLRSEGSKGELPLAFSADGAMLATRNEHGQVTLWDIATRRPRNALRQVATDLSATFSPDGRLFAVSRWEPAQIYHVVSVIEFATGRELATVDIGMPNLADFQFSSDGSAFQIIAWNLKPSPPTPSESWVVRTWDTATWLERLADSVPLPQPWRLCERVGAVSHDGQIVATVDPYAPDVKLWDAVTGANLATLLTPLTPPATGNYVCDFSHDGLTLAVGQNNLGRLDLWDIPTRRLRHSFVGLSRGDRVESIRFGPGPSRNLVTTVSNWDFNTSLVGDVMNKLSRLVYSDWPPRIPMDVVVRDIPTAGIRARLRGEGIAIVSPDGSTLATAGNSGAVTLWDLTSK